MLILLRKIHGNQIKSKPLTGSSLGMLSRRLIGYCPYQGEHVVQSIGFKRHLPLGKPNVTVGFLDQWGIDEIFLTGYRQR